MKTLEIIAATVHGLKQEIHEKQLKVDAYERDLSHVRELYRHLPSRTHIMSDIEVYNFEQENSK